MGVHISVFGLSSSALPGTSLRSLGARLAGNRRLAPAGQRLNYLGRDTLPLAVKSPRVTGIVAEASYDIGRDRRIPAQPLKENVVFVVFQAVTEVLQANRRERPVDTVCKELAVAVVVLPMPYPSPCKAPRQ